MRQILRFIVWAIALVGLSNERLLAQEETLTTELIDHSNVRSLIVIHKKVIKKDPFMDGYRIQIYSGNSRDEANQTKMGFYSKFPSIRCYTLYQQPYYKVRVGDYPNPEAAKGDLRLLGRYYPSSFLVPEKIRRIETDDKDEKDDNKKN